MKPKQIKGKVEINYGMDNFCYIWTKNNKRVDLTEWMNKFKDKDIQLDVKCVLNDKEKAE